MSDEKVRVRFITKHEEYKVADVPFAVPSKLGRYGLSEVINHLLELDPVVPFDFLLQNELLRTSIATFLQSHKISSEEIVVIEYMPIVGIDGEAQSVECPAWIGCLAQTENAVIAGCYDGAARYISTTTKQIVSTFQLHDQPIRSIATATTAAGTVLVTGSKNQEIKCTILNATKSAITASPLSVLSGHQNSVESLTITDSHIFSGDWNGNIFAYDLGAATAAPTAATATGSSKKSKNNSGTAVSTSVPVISHAFSILGHTQAVSGLEYFSGKLYSGSWDHSFREWDVTKQECIRTFTTSKVITSISSSPNYNNVATSSPDGKIRIFDLRINDVATTKQMLTDGTNWISQVKWHPENEMLLLSSNYNGQCCLWDIRSSVPLASPEMHSGKALAVDWVGEMCVSGGADCCVKFADVGSNS